MVGESTIDLLLPLCRQAADGAQPLDATQLLGYVQGRRQHVIGGLEARLAEGLAVQVDQVVIEQFSRLALRLPLCQHTIAPTLPAWFSTELLVVVLPVVPSPLVQPLLVEELRQQISHLDIVQVREWEVRVPV